MAFIGFYGVKFEQYIEPYECFESDTTACSGHYTSWQEQLEHDNDDPAGSLTSMMTFRLECFM